MNDTNEDQRTVYTGMVKTDGEPWTNEGEAEPDTYWGWCYPTGWYPSPEGLLDHQVKQVLPRLMEEHLGPKYENSNVRIWEDDQSIVLEYQFEPCRPGERCIYDPETNTYTRRQTFTVAACQM